MLLEIVAEQIDSFNAAAETKTIGRNFHQVKGEE
jgi:hypothetical protein